jgi:hypothetical protein
MIKSLQESKVCMLFLHCRLDRINDTFMEICTDIRLLHKMFLNTYFDQKILLILSDKMSQYFAVTSRIVPKLTTVVTIGTKHLKIELEIIFAKFRYKLLKNILENGKIRNNEIKQRLVCCDLIAACFSI